MKPPEYTMQEIQLLHCPRPQDWVQVSECQAFAGDSHTLDDFGGYLCCLDAVSNVA
jgi:hypothetical protein